MPKPFASGLRFEERIAPRPPPLPAGYAEYLLSPRWAELRAAALERDGNCCRFCPRETYLQVHHRRYPKRWGEESVEDLTTVCSGCHAVLTWFRGREADVPARMAALRRR